jgi:hypothetical protein
VIAPIISSELPTADMGGDASSGQGKPASVNHPIYVVYLLSVGSFLNKLYLILTVNPISDGPGPSPYLAPCH